jgi:glycosyltransferase involved in cell wall biosynthesis
MMRNTAAGQTVCLGEISTVPNHAKLDILLATYNGARFLKCQIDSILEQMRPGWRILIRDDGSTDGTAAILQRLSARWPECITLLADRGERLGPSGNFAHLMQSSDADYMMFCDQDDIWLPSRILKPLERIEALEQTSGRDTPVLVHTDLVVVDENLRRVASSFLQYSHLDPKIGGTLSRLLLRNVVTGCVTTINRALASLACPIPAAAIMHDWWLALLAAACGRLECLPEATVLYRQHASNAIGAHPWRWSKAVQQSTRRLLGKPAPSGELPSLCAQARALLQRADKRLPAGHRATIEAMAHIEQCGFFKRRQEVLRHGLLKCG